MLKSNQSEYLYHKTALEYTSSTPTPLVYVFFSEMSMNIPKGFKKSKMYNFNTQGNHVKEFFKSLTQKGLLSKIRSSFIKSCSSFNSSLGSLNGRNLSMFSELFDLVDVTSKIITPTFKFTFHLIDKKIRKFSRGKSGKYRLALNYLPPFKRMKYVFKVLKKNLKIMRPKTFHKRLSDLLILVNSGDRTNLLQRFDSFSNNQVYNNNRVKVLKLSN